MKGRTPLCLVVFTLMLALPVLAQQTPPDLQQEIERLKEGQQAIQKELQEIKKLLQSRRPPARRAEPDVSGLVFNLRDNPVKGDQTASLTLIEFTDYQ